MFHRTEILVTDCFNPTVEFEPFFLENVEFLAVFTAGAVSSLDCIRNPTQMSHYMYSVIVFHYVFIHTKFVCSCFYDWFPTNSSSPTTIVTKYG